MQMSEVARLIRALQFIGLTAEDVQELILFVEEGGDIEEKLRSIKDHGHWQSNPLK